MFLTILLKDNMNRLQIVINVTEKFQPSLTYISSYLECHSLPICHCHLLFSPCFLYTCGVETQTAFNQIQGKQMFTFSTDDLEAALMRCNNVLTTYTDPATKKWDTRMSNLTMKWDSSRKCLLEAVLSCEGPPSPNICPHCCEGKVLIRCSDCPKRFYCPSCDRKVHNFILAFPWQRRVCKWFL